MDYRCCKAALTIIIDSLLLLALIVQILSLGVSKYVITFWLVLVLRVCGRLRRLLICCRYGGVNILLRMEHSGLDWGSRCCLFFTAVARLLLLIFLSRITITSKLLLTLIGGLLFYQRLLHFKTCIWGAIEDRRWLLALYFIDQHDAASRNGVIGLFTVI